jgi:hypothetical protein
MFENSKPTDEPCNDEQGRENEGSSRYDERSLAAPIELVD